MDDRLCHSVGLALLGRVGSTHFESIEGAAGSGLLDHVGEFVRQQPVDALRTRLILSRAKHDVAANRVCQTVHRLCRLSRFPICMDPHLAEVMAEAWFEKCAGLRIQRLAGRTKYVVHNERRRIRTAAGCLALSPVLLASFALASRASRSSDTRTCVVVFQRAQA